MTVIKRDRKDTSQELVQAIEKLSPLLKDQGDKDAAADLEEAARTLAGNAVGSADHKSAVAKIIDAFEGEHELMAYTHQRANSSDWTEAEELSLASSRVLNLARRMR